MFTPYEDDKKIIDDGLKWIKDKHNSTVDKHQARETASSDLREVFRVLKESINGELLGDRYYKAGHGERELSKIKLTFRRLRVPMVGPEDDFELYIDLYHNSDSGAPDSYRCIVADEYKIPGSRLQNVLIRLCMIDKPRDVATEWSMEIVEESQDCTVIYFNLPPKEPEKPIEGLPDEVDPANDPKNPSE